jgi:hypothetical protein
MPQRQRGEKGFRLTALGQILRVSTDGGPLGVVIARDDAISRGVHS